MYTNIPRSFESCLSSYHLQVGQVTTIDRILELGKRYLHMADKTRDATAVLLAK